MGRGLYGRILWLAGGGGRRLVDDIEACYHSAEIIPASEDDLYNMDQKEDAIAEGQDEMNDAGVAIPAKNGGQPVELGWFVDGQAGEDGAEPHDDDSGIGNLLRPVVFYLGGCCLAEVQVVQGHEQGFLKGMAVG